MNTKDNFQTNVKISIFSLILPVFPKQLFIETGHSDDDNISRQIFYQANVNGKLRDIFTGHYINKPILKKQTIQKKKLVIEFGYSLAVRLFRGGSKNESRS